MSHMRNKNTNSKAILVMDPNAIANKDKHRKQKHQVIYERMHEIKNGVIADVKIEFKRDQIMAKQSKDLKKKDQAIANLRAALKKGTCLAQTKRHRSANIPNAVKRITEMAICLIGLNVFEFAVVAPSRPKRVPYRRIT